MNNFLKIGNSETNTASNLGAGVGVFDSKNIYDLRFKSLVEGANVTLTDSGSGEITIDSLGGGGDSNIDGGRADTLYTVQDIDGGTA